MAKCYDPLLCYTGQKRRIIRNWSMASPLIRTQAQQVWNCGKCLYCRKKQSYELAMRCVLTASLYDESAFLTLTYDESKPGYHNRMQYDDIQKFKKKLVSHCWRKYKKRLEIFNVHEYGKNNKKHWHLIVFGHDFADKKIYTKKKGIPLYTSQILEQIWGHGFVTIGDVTEASAMYQSLYTSKDHKNGNAGSDKKAKSKHQGLGKKWFYKNFKKILRSGYVRFNGFNLPLPRYFERIAHKHYCHFYDSSAFFSTQTRGPLYTPFRKNEQNIEIADLYSQYKKIKQQKIKLLEANWEEVISKYIDDRLLPTFVQSGKNAIYDHKNKIIEENF